MITALKTKGQRLILPQFSLIDDPHPPLLTPLHNVQLYNNLRGCIC